MKIKCYILLLSSIVIITILLNIILYLDVQNQLKQRELNQLNQINQKLKANSKPVFIWNDDMESLPIDSTPIMLEFTSNDTIYLGPLE